MSQKEIDIELQEKTKLMNLQSEMTKLKEQEILL
jgi:hypothetical protein